METKHIEVNPVRRLVCGVREMLEPEAVTTIVRLGQSGWGAKRIARTLGIARNTVRRYLNAGGPVPYRQPQRDSLLDEASRAQMTLREALLFLAEREVARRDTRRIQMGMKLARFPCVRTLEGFDFDAQPSIDPGQIRDLSTGRWIGHGQDLLLLGPPGVGKTHLAVALGREAVDRGYTVLFTSAAALMAGLTKAHADGRLKEKLLQLSKPKLLIIDELGYLPLEPAAAHLFFQLVSRRYERASMLITSNRPVGEWGQVFGDAVAATAILDRLLHHSQVITIRGDSYRLRDKRRSGLLQKAAAPTPITSES